MTRRRSADADALPTEALHPRADVLDELSTAQLVALLAAEERRSVAAVVRALPEIARAADLFIATLSAGGRILYAGAGTSGRLGILDAAELPPTFGTDPSRVLALIAGGPRAITRAVEGAEDRPAAALRDLTRLRLGKHDLLCAIAASGVTPYTRAALRFARRKHSRTVFITCAPQTPNNPADITISLAVGPEVIAGSTRLKAGTATKLVLNALSTTAMIKLGKVYRGRMVDLTATNSKLRRRALTILTDLSGLPPKRAGTLLKSAQGSVKLALAAALLDVPVAQARRALARVDGHLARLSPAQGQ